MNHTAKSTKISQPMYKIDWDILMEFKLEVLCDLSNPAYLI